MLEPYLDLLDLCYFEVTEAFGGLADEHVWKRPASPPSASSKAVGYHFDHDFARFKGQRWTEPG